jgi:hypothetical protein
MYRIKVMLLPIIVFTIAAALAACGNDQSALRARLVGTWQGVGNASGATIRLFDDGTFTTEAPAPQYLIAKGKYTILGSNGIKFEVQESTPDIDPEEASKTFYLELSEDTMTLRDVQLKNSLIYKRKGG